MESTYNLLLFVVLILVGLYLFKTLGSGSTFIEISNADSGFSGEAPQAYIDLNNTYEQALFVGGGKGQPDQLLVRNKNGNVVDVIDQTPLNSRAATYDVVAADLDYNGYSDLVVARSNGVILYKNKGKGRFEVMKLSDNFGKGPLKVSVVDYNKDGHADVYISSAAGRSKLLEGIGGGIMFEDVTGLVGNGVRLAEGGQLSQLEDAVGHHEFRDVNNDRIPDLVGKTVYQGTRGASGVKFTSGFQFLKRAGGFFTNADLKDVVSAAKSGFNWINIHANRQKMGGRNFVGVRLPDRIPFFNSTVHLVTVDDRTGKLRKQTRQVKGGKEILKFDIGDDNRVLHLSVRTIYENVYEHPFPKINVISSFRDAKW